MEPAGEPDSDPAVPERITGSSPGGRHQPRVRAKVSSQEKALFKIFSFGVVTNRDEWVYDTDQDRLVQKVGFFIDVYNGERRKFAHVRDAKQISGMLDTSIKWTRAVKRDFMKGIEYDFNRARIAQALYRPYVRRLLYFDTHLNEMHNRTRTFFGLDAQFRNRSIVFSHPTSEKPFMVLATDRCPDMHLVGAASGSVILGRMRVIDGRVVDNVTNWALEAFRVHYEAGVSRPKRPITKDAIFCYVYGVLHDPIYRDKYALNLKREGPRIPFYTDLALGRLGRGADEPAPRL